MTSSSSSIRWVVGLMTGTSLDGLDAALVKITGSGLQLQCQYIDIETAEFPASLHQSLTQLVQNQPLSPLEILRTSRLLGQLHATAIAALMRRHPAIRLDLISVHGQTICHAPHDPIGPLSWQLLDPWPIVHTFHTKVVCDLRQADLIAGGQGAPVTPLSDWLCYRHPAASRLIVNLGGICNVTFLPPDSTSATTSQSLSHPPIQGSDIGPCNLLLDGLTQKLFPGLLYDKDGKLACRGGSSSILYHLILQADFFKRPVPRTTGREDFTPEWIDYLIQTAGLPPHDLLASAVDAIAKLILNQAEQYHADQLVLAGGGTRNKALEQSIRSHAREQNIKVLLSDDLGIPLHAREAVAFAVLGALAEDGVPITLSSITGAKQVGCAGVWIYP